LRPVPIERLTMAALQISLISVTPGDVAAT
jgi:hypothetical protein